MKCEMAMEKDSFEVFRQIVNITRCTKQQCRTTNSFECPLYALQDIFNPCFNVDFDVS